MRTRTIVVGAVVGCGGLLVVLVAACAGFFYLTFKNLDAEISPKIDGLFAAADNGTFGERYATGTSPEFRQTTTRADWEQIGSSIKTRLGSLKSKRLVQFNVQQFNADQYADVAYSAEFEKGSGEIHARFRRIDGQWRLVNFRVDSPEFLKDLATGKCPHCGQACPAEAKFCPHCGKPLGDDGQNGPAPKKDGARADDSSAEK